MKMDNNKKMSRIKKDILKSGMPLEVEISSILRQSGWLVIQQAAYVDRDKEEVRTVDIVAMRTKDKKTLALVVECKRSEKEIWTFHTLPKSSDEYLMSISLVGSLMKLHESKLSMDMFKKAHFANMDIKVGTSNYVPFKYKDSFFEAQQQVTKAAEYFTQKWRKHYLIYPVIVFDGEMYEFDISGKDLRVGPIEYLQFTGSTKGRRTLIPCLIDVMKKGHFLDFLESIQEEIEVLK